MKQFYTIIFWLGCSSVPQETPSTIEIQQETSEVSDPVHNPDSAPKVLQKKPDILALPPSTFPVLTSAPSTPNLSVRVVYEKGFRDKLLTKKTLQKARRSLLACYQKQYLRDPLWEGKMSPVIVTDVRGVVRATFSLGGPSRLVSCVDGVLRSIVFPVNTCGTAELKVSLRWYK